MIDGPHWAHKLDGFCRQSFRLRARSDNDRLNAIFNQRDQVRWMTGWMDGWSSLNSFNGSLLNGVFAESSYRTRPSLIP